MIFAIALFCLGWIISICLHEFGHAIIAYWGGDTSVKDKGYLTLNPIKYAHPVLSLLLPLVFLLLGGIPLPGAAVYIDSRQLRGRVWQSAVAAAGPIGSLLVAGLLVIPFHTPWITPLPGIYEVWGWRDSAPIQTLVWSVVACLISLNIYVAILNLLPIPPLDGFGILEPWLPSPLRSQLQRYSWISLIVLFWLLWEVRPFSRWLFRLSVSIPHLAGVPTDLMINGYSLLMDRSLVLLLSALLTAIALYWLVRAFRQPYELLEIPGFLLILVKQYHPALACLDRVVQHCPNNYEAWYNRGNVLHQLRRYEEAVESYDRAIALKPNYYDPTFNQGTHQVWGNRGNSLEQLQQFEAAVASHAKAAALRADHPLAWYNQAVAFGNWGKCEEAIAANEKAIQLDPNYYQAWYNKGVMLQKLGRSEEALTAFETVLRLKPGFAPAWLNRGAALTELQRLDEAMASFKRADRLTGGGHLTWYNRGNVLMQTGQLEDAMTAYDQALRLNPQYDLAWVNKGLVLRKLNQPEAAIAAYQEAIRLNPQSQIAWNNWIVLLFQQHQYSEALAVSDQSMQALPNNPAMLTVRGTVLAHLEQFAAAIAIYDQVIALQPDFASAWYDKACCLIMQDKPQDAIASLETAFRLKPSLKQHAATDTSLDPVRTNPQFQQLLA